MAEGGPALGPDGGPPWVGGSHPAVCEDWAELSGLRPPTLLWGLPAQKWGAWGRGQVSRGRGAGLAGMGKADSQLACWEVSRGQGRTLQPSRPHLQPFLSPWHSQMPTAHQTSRQALSPTTWGSQSATTHGGGEAEVPAQVPSVSCPQSWGRSPAGSLEQSIRFLGVGGVGWAGGWQGLEPALGRHLAPNSNPGQRQWSLIGGRVSGGRSAAGGLSVTSAASPLCP